MDQLKVSVREEDTYTVVALAGEADMIGAPRLRDALDQAMARPARLLVVDLSGLAFADSTATQVLLIAHGRYAADGGRMGLVAPRPIVARVLTLIGADQIIPVHPDLDSALTPE